MRTYVFKQYIHIMHSATYFREDAHSHTLQVFAYFASAEQEDNAFFSHVEKRLRAFFDAYDGKFLNEEPEFFQNATIENIGEVFFTQLSGIFNGGGQQLVRLEIRETPLRSYAIGLEPEE